MSSIFKFIGTELSISSANSVGENKLVRVTNVSNSLTVLTVANTTATYANVSLTPYESLTVVKETTDTVAGENLRAVAVAYRN